uniref:Laminin N-terminal domain-containing protein n=1 Tax=Eptatretus burgeri TaxID=7764 RepID=A0A8C4NBG1_EPTBU
MVPTVPTGLAWPDEPLRRVLLLLGAALSLGSASQLPPYSRCKVTVHSSDDVAAWEYHSCQPQTTDLARYARIHVDPMDITCGKPPENICALENPYLCAECDVSMLGLSHPPHLMVDAEVPDTSTFWQSASWHRTHPEPLRANITFSWGREVELTHDVVITFQSRRPAALVLERSRDHGRSWRPLQFYADDCLEEFGMEQRRALDLLSEDVTKVICTEEYSGSFASKGIRTVRMEIQNRTALLAGPRLPPGRVSASPYGRMTANPALRDFLTLTDLRLSLLRPATGGTFIDKENLQKYHYAISDVLVPGRCQCNLHASECVFNAGRLACVCQHRTAGPDCSKCQRGFRSRRWRQGSYLPYPMGSANVCLPNNAPAAFPNHERIWSSSSPLEGSQRRLGDAEVTHRQGLGHGGGGGAISHAALWPSVSSVENKEHSSGTQVLNFIF